jgi:hypothetical protein
MLHANGVMPSTPAPETLSASHIHCNPHFVPSPPEDMKSAVGDFK